MITRHIFLSTSLYIKCLYVYAYEYINIVYYTPSAPPQYIFANRIEYFNETITWNDMNTVIKSIIFIQMNDNLLNCSELSFNYLLESFFTAQPIKKMGKLFRLMFYIYIYL